MSESPITQWIDGASCGDAESEHALWNHYFGRVLRLARTRMFTIQGAVYDEEDAALSAMNSLFRGIREQRFPELHDRHNLWRLLTLITRRKLRAQWRKETADCRRPSEGEADVEAVDIKAIISREPSPDFVAEMMNETERLLDSLEDESLRRIAVMRMDGFTHDEIANRLGCATRTVRRKVDRIRDIWGVSEDD